MTEGKGLNLDIPGHVSECPGSGSFFYLFSFSLSFMKVLYISVIKLE
jgi:hypothetical protein